MSRNVELTVCSCPAQFGYMPCTCSVRIPVDPDEVDARSIRMALEAFQAIGVCPDCGCTEEECECRF